MSETIEFAEFKRVEMKVGKVLEVVRLIDGWTLRQFRQALAAADAASAVRAPKVAQAEAAAPSTPRSR